MNNESAAAKLSIDRLIELTRMNQLPWTMLYPDDLSANDYTSDEDFLRDITMPHAYAVEDMVYGFGMIVLRLKDPDNEEYDPALYSQGTKLEVSDADLGLLRDMIAVFFEEIQQGRAPNQQLRVENMIEQAVAPYSQELERARQQIKATEVLVHKQVEIIDKLSLTTVYASQPRAPLPLPGQPARMPVPAQAPNSSGPVPPTSAGPHQQLPFNTTTLKAALRRVFERTDQFEQHFNEARCAEIVQSVVHDLTNGNS